VKKLVLAGMRVRLGVLTKVFTPVLRTRAGRDKVERGQWAWNQTTKPKSDRLAGRPYGSKPRAHHTR
jgi:hypothetical protein